jgi:purine nucleosidase
VTVKLVIDSDGGIDDATALWFAATSPRCDLNGVTAVWGNVDANQAVNNLCAVLEAANRTDVPIARGARGPTGPAPELARPTFVHGEYGLGANRVVAERTAYTDQPASVLLMQLTAQHPSELTLVTLGPLSTVGALALDRPDWCAQIKRVVVMGGAISVAGNVLPLSEANIAHDPMAAQAVFTAPWTEPPLLVPLDVTYQAVLRDEHFNMLAARGSAATRFLDEPLRFYRHGGSRLVPGHQCPCHDLLATMAAVVPDLVSGPIVELSVDTGSSAAWGATVADLRPIVAGDLSTPMRRSASAGAVEVGLTVDLDLFYGMLDEFLAGDA